jgi:hypothetical protein
MTVPRQTVLSTLAPVRSEGVGVLVGRGLRCRHEAHQVSEPLLMSGASLLEGEGLMAVRLRAEIRTYLVEEAAEA